jgi:hypothetical protein
VLIDKLIPDDLVFENNIIEGNTFTGRLVNGGGLSIYQSSGLFQNNIIKDNKGSNGGGVYMTTPTDTVVFINNTISGNEAEYGGGIYATNADALIANTIVWGNTANTQDASIYKAASTVNVQYSDIEGTTVYPGEGNINLDPDMNDTCKIDQNSPCEDAGTESVAAFGTTYYAPSYDLDGTPRPWHLGFDIGAYECDIIDKLPDDASSNKDLNSFTVNPNPTDGKFQITSSKSQTNFKNQISNTTIEIVDLTGNVVATFNQEPGTRNQELDITNLPAGVYFIRIYDDEQSMVKKIIKL